MALIAVTSSGGAPGATTSALAWALNWPRQALLAECSSAGGTVVSGLFRNQVAAQSAQRGLWSLNLSVVQKGVEATGAALGDHVVALGGPPRHPLLLPGLTDPFLAPQLSPSWPALARLLRALPIDVLADVGPLGPQAPFQVLAEADLVVVVMRPTMVQVTAALPRLQHLRKALGPTAVLGLCVIGPSRPKIGDELNYGIDVVQRHLGDFAFVITLPFDPKTASRLSDGLKGPRNIEVAPLMREAQRTCSVIDSCLQERLAHLAHSSDQAQAQVPVRAPLGQVVS